MNFLRVIKYALLVLLVGAALVLTSLRILLPGLSNYQAQLEQRVSVAIGQPVKFEQLSARLLGFAPELTLGKVAILSAEDNRPILQLNQLVVRVSLVRSLINLRLSPQLVRITGAQFSLARRNGRLSLVGLQSPVRSNAEDSDELLEWLLQQRRIEIIETELSYHDFDQELEYRFSAAVFRLVSRHNGLQLSGHLAVAGLASGGLELAGLLRSTAVEDLNDAPWDVYLKVNNLQWRGPLPGDLKLDGKMNMQTWLSGRGPALEHLEGSLNWADPLLRNAEGLPVIKGAALRSSFAWNRLADGWRARLSSVEFSSVDGDWRGEQLVASRAESALRIDGGGIDLAVGTQLLTGLLPDQDRYRLVAASLAAQGRVDRFQLDLEQSVDHEWELSALHAEVGDIDINSYKNLPAISGLSGNVWLTAKSGRAEVDSVNLALWFPNLFRQTLEFDQLSATLDWHQDSTGLTAFLRNLDAGNNDLDVQVKGKVELLKGRSARLQLVGLINDFDLQQLSRYLPVGVMPATVVRWLDDALREGRLTSAGVLWNGALDEFPYPHGGGRFLATGQVQSGVLDYAPGKHFPLITDLDARLKFSGTRMEITGQAGKMFDSSLSNVLAVIDDLGRKGNHIAVTGEVTGPLADGLKFIQQSPLQKKIGQPLQDLEVTGNSQLDLALDIPFHPGQVVKVDGDLQLPENNLYFSNSRIALEKVSGGLKFSERGIAGSGLQAQLFGGPARLAIESLPSGGIGISGTGRARLEAVSDYLGWQEIGAMAGKADWQSRLQVETTGIDLEVNANLIDTEISLPAPLAKKVGQPGQLKLHLGCDCGRPEAPLALSIAIDDAWFVDMELGRRPQKMVINRGVITAQKKREMPEQGVLLAGNLPAVDFGLWQGWISSLPAGGGGPLVDQLDVEIEQLDILGQKIPDLHLGGRYVAGEWQLDLASTQVEGSVVYGATASRLELDLQKLSLLVSEQVAAEQGAAGVGELPSLDINIENLLVNSRPLGKLTITASHDDDSLVFDTIDLNSGHSHFSGNGRWQSLKNSGGDSDEHSWFAGELVTTDFGEALSVLGYSRSVSGGEGTASLRLNWPGSPQKFALEQLNGDLSFDMKGGSLLAIEPGFGRLFGVLSLSTLQRRISFDFRDLVGTGFVFDDFETNVTARNGQADVERLWLAGPAADINVSGRLDLVKSELDMEAGVVPRVTQSLPLAVSIGSLGVGAAVFIGQKLLASRIDNVTSQNYRVTGSIDEPKVEAIGESRIKKLFTGGRSTARP